MRIETLDRMRRLFILVLPAARFICAIGRTWAPAAVLWLRQPGGKLGLQSDRDGAYVLLALHEHAARAAAGVVDSAFDKRNQRDGIRPHLHGDFRDARRLPLDQ